MDNEIIEKILSVKVEVETNKGKKEVTFTNLTEPLLSHITESKDEIQHGLIVGRNISDDYHAIIFGNADITIL